MPCTCPFILRKNWSPH